jgi:hypothetical protein
LLGDRRVEGVGLVDKSPADPADERVHRAGPLGDYDLVVSDAESPGDVVRRSLDAGVSCVVWRDWDGHTGDIDGLVVLVGCNLAGGIAPCLASHEVARADHVEDITIAWTEPGAPLRSGEPLAFPDPVGGRWGKPRGRSGSFAAPVSGEWAGAMARVTSTTRDVSKTRIVGVADLAPHLEGLALAAGALAVASGAYPPGGLRRPADAAERYLGEALAAGLDVAASTLDA